LDGGSTLNGKIRKKRFFILIHLSGRKLKIVSTFGLKTHSLTHAK